MLALQGVVMFTVAEMFNLPLIKPLHLISAFYIDSGL